MVECKYDAISRGSWDESQPSPLLISGRKWWPPKAVENFRGADGYDAWCSAGVCPPPSLPPSNRCFKVPPPPTTPSFKLSWKRRFQRNFSRAGRFYLLPLCPSRRSTRWKNWRIFWNFETHFGESLNFDFPREKSFLLCNFEFSRIFSCEKYLLWAMITDSRSWELRFFKG